MKKLLAMLLALVMLFAFVPATLAEDADFTLVIKGGDVSENLDENGNLAVKLFLNGPVEDNTLFGLTFELTFNDEQITFVSDEVIDGVTAAINDTTSGALRIACASQNGVEITEETCIATLYFKLAETLKEGDEIAFALTDGAFAETEDPMHPVAHDVAANLAPFVFSQHVHVEGDPVQENVKAATCTEAGSYDEVVYCKICNEEISRKTVEVPALGHDWDAPTYTWAEDDSTVTASRVCKNDASHVETETVEAVLTVTVEPTKTSEGEGIRTATFENPAFEEQSKTVVIDRLRLGWQKIDDKWYYYNDNFERVTGWQKLGGLWYYFDEDGVMLTGWQQIDNNWYYFLSSGSMVRGIQVLGGVTYVFHSTGELGNGWVKLDGQWYYTNAGGVMQKGWQTINGKTYYFDANGIMLYGIQTIDGVRYCFKGTGELVVNAWAKVDDKWYYCDENGAIMTGLQTINGDKYYLAENGEMLTGWQKIEGEWHFFDTSSGKMATNWKKIDDKWYFFNSDGVMQKGWQQINNNWYYFNDAGDMHTGWLSRGGVWYYFKPTGEMVTGTYEIDGVTYEFSSSGACLNP